MPAMSETRIRYRVCTNEHRTQVKARGSRRHPPEVFLCTTSWSWAAGRADMPPPSTPTISVFLWPWSKRVESAEPVCFVGASRQRHGCTPPRSTRPVKRSSEFGVNSSGALARLAGRTGSQEPGGRRAGSWPFRPPGCSQRRHQARQRPTGRRQCGSDVTGRQRRNPHRSVRDPRNRIRPAQHSRIRLRRGSHRLVRRGPRLERTARPGRGHWCRSDRMRIRLVPR